MSEVKPAERLMVVRGENVKARRGTGWQRDVNPLGVRRLMRNVGATRSQRFDVLADSCSLGCGYGRANNGRQRCRGVRPAARPHIRVQVGSEHVELWGGVEVELDLGPSTFYISFFYVYAIQRDLNSRMGC